MADMSSEMTPGTPANIAAEAPANSTDQAPPRTPPEAALGAPATVKAQAPLAAAGRPGLVTFAAIMLFLLTGFQLTWALVEFSNAARLTAITYGTFGGYLWLWGLLDIAFALLAFYAGIDLLSGGKFGQVFGLIVAGVSAIRWFFYVPAEPGMAIVMIAIDVLIIYGLVKHADYFSANGTTARSAA